MESDFRKCAFSLKTGIKHGHSAIAPPASGAGRESEGVKVFSGCPEYLSVKSLNRQRA